MVSRNGRAEEACPHTEWPVHMPGIPRCLWERWHQLSWIRAWHPPATAKACAQLIPLRSSSTGVHSWPLRSLRPCLWGRAARRLVTWPGWALIKSLLGWRPLCLDKSIKSSLLAQGGCWLGPSTDVVRKLPEKSRRLLPRQVLVWASSLWAFGDKPFLLTQLSWGPQMPGRVWGMRDPRVWGCKGAGHALPAGVPAPQSRCHLPSSSPLSSLHLSLFCFIQFLSEQTYTLHMILWTSCRDGERGCQVSETRVGPSHTRERAEHRAKKSHRT